MKFKIATGFDTEIRDEVFTTVGLGDEALRELVTGVLNRLDYAQRESLLERFEKDKKLTVVADV